MADADLFDLDGKVHHLADFKGNICYLIFGAVVVVPASWLYLK